MNQRERNRTLLNLRNGKLRVLVATDVAARGIDVAGISHVINFDLPKQAEDYVHRIGRTGRGGASGIAISFASNRDAVLLKRIERYTDQRLQMHTIEGLEPKYKLRTGSSSDRPRGNGGFGGNRGNGQGGKRGVAGQGGSGYPRSVPDSRHSHAGHKEGRSHTHAAPRNPERDFGARSGAPRRGGDRPSFALGRGQNSGNKW
jgi:superfamily II DNA/RNA helicase